MNEEDMDKEMREFYAKTGGRNIEDIFRHYWTCRRAFIDYQVARFHALANRIPERRVDLGMRQISYADVVTVFSHLFLEATIYDYGATNLSDSYMKKYIDRLNFLSRWVVIPRLVTGKTFPTQSQAYQMLGKVNRARNGLVHFKTRRVLGQTVSQAFETSMENHIAPSECFDCMSEALRELRNLGPEKWLPFQWGTIENVLEAEYKQIEAIADKHIGAIAQDRTSA